MDLMSQRGKKEEEAAGSVILVKPWESHVVLQCQMKSVTSHSTAQLQVYSLVCTTCTHFLAPISMTFTFTDNLSLS